MVIILYKSPNRVQGSSFRLNNQDYTMLSQRQAKSSVEAHLGAMKIYRPYPLVGYTSSRRHKIYFFEEGRKLL